jgi:hypothetical protein
MLHTFPNGFSPSAGWIREEGVELQSTRSRTAALVIAFAVFAGAGPASAAAGQGQSASPPSAAAAPPSGNAEAGRLTFAKKGCYECHGREGQGSPTTGPRLGPNPVAFAAFVRAVRIPRAQMPPYPEKTLSDTELADLYAFLQGRAKPAGSIDSLVPR